MQRVYNGSMTLEEIQAKAEKLAAKYNPAKLAPFPWENVMDEHADLVIHHTDTLPDEISGATIYQENKFFVLINRSKPETRQNFTLGHELGHYFLHTDTLKKEGFVDTENFLDNPNILYRVDPSDRSVLERQANRFAAALLMPGELVQKAWQANPNIEETAAIFRVSTVAMSIRLTELGLVA